MDKPRTRPQSRSGPPIPASGPGFERVAQIEIDAVTPFERGFTLRGLGAPPDPAEYRLEVHFDLPLDARTRAVVGELLAQSDMTIARRDLTGRNS